MLDRRELLLGASAGVAQLGQMGRPGTAGIAQLGQHVLPRITLPALLRESRTPALGGAIVTSKRAPAIEVEGRRRSGQHVGVEPDDLWLIGSNTQAMTALLYGRLAEYGKTHWGAKLTDLFPDVAVDDGWRGVAVDELMAHVAGVSDAPFATPEALHKWLTRHPPDQRAAPGLRQSHPGRAPRRTARRLRLLRRRLCDRRRRHRARQQADLGGLHLGGIVQPPGAGQRRLRCADRAGALGVMRASTPTIRCR